MCFLLLCLNKFIFFPLLFCSTRHDVPYWLYHHGPWMKWFLFWVQGCLSLLGLLSQNRLSDLTKSSSVSFESCDICHQHANMVGFWWDPTSWSMDGHLLSLSLCGRDRDHSSHVCSYNDTNPLTRMLTSCLNYLPKAPPKNTIILEVRSSTLECWGNSNISSIALSTHRIWSTLNIQH